MNNKTPKTREEVRATDLFKGNFNSEEADLLCYSIKSGIVAAIPKGTENNPAFLYLDESLIGKDLEGFISVSFGETPSGGFGLGDSPEKSIYRVKYFDNQTYQCLRYLKYYDSLPEKLAHTKLHQEDWLIDTNS